jgi:hypothetical protein
METQSLETEAIQSLEVFNKQELDKSIVDRLNYLSDRLNDWNSWNFRSDAIIEQRDFDLDQIKNLATRQGYDPKPYQQLYISRLKRISKSL